VEFDDLLAELRRVSRAVSGHETSGLGTTGRSSTEPGSLQNGQHEGAVG
jgi:hypothetical protein